MVQEKSLLGERCVGTAPVVQKNLFQWFYPYGCIFLLLPLLSLLLSACDGGIFSNANWQTIGLQRQQLRVLQVSGKDPNTLYAGDAHGHIFVSSSGGQKWSEQSAGLPLPNTLHALSFDASGQKLYAATDKGLFTNAEGATTLWQKISVAGLPSTAFTALVFLPGPSAAIYVGTTDQGIFVSRDGGTSWQAARSGLPLGIAVNDLSFDPAQKQIWAATAQGAYRLENGAAVWQAFNNGLPPASMVNTIVPASASGGTPGLLYMGTNHGVFLSQDSGAHWTPTSEALSGVIVYHILIDFRNSSSVAAAYLATNIGVLQSTNLGQSWPSVATGLPRGTPVYALTIGATHNAQLYAAGDGLYEFPGTESSFDLLRILTYVLLVVFFFLLYRLVMRGRSAAKRMLKPERI
jgi:ligand-binding sensor domain-containing protein